MGHGFYSAAWCWPHHYYYYYTEYNILRKPLGDFFLLSLRLNGDACTIEQTAPQSKAMSACVDTPVDRNNALLPCSQEGGSSGTITLVYGAYMN